MTDAFHNFHPQYQQYTQYSASKIDRSIRSARWSTVWSFFFLMMALFSRWLWISQSWRTDNSERRRDVRRGRIGSQSENDSDSSPSSVDVQCSYQPTTNCCPQWHCDYRCGYIFVYDGSCSSGSHRRTFSVGPARPQRPRCSAIALGLHGKDNASQLRRRVPVRELFWLLLLNTHTHTRTLKIMISQKKKSFSLPSCVSSRRYVDTHALHTHTHDPNVTTSFIFRLAGTGCVIFS